jgi:hypothetical protein
MRVVHFGKVPDTRSVARSHPSGAANDGQDLCDDSGLADLIQLPGTHRTALAPAGTSPHVAFTQANFPIRHFGIEL